jgi:hypothetical protein
VPEAVSLNGIGFNLMRSVGPAVGGAIVATFGAAVAFAVYAVCYLPFIATLLRWNPDRPHQNLPREPFVTALGSGLRYVAMSPAIVSVLARSFLFGFGAVACLALLPIVARNHMQGRPLTYGLLLGGFGMGAIGGGFVNPRIRQRLSGEGVVRVAFLGFAAGVTGLAVSPTLWTGLPVRRGGGLLGACAVAVQRHGATVLAALSLLIGAVVGLALPLPGFGKADLSPSDQFRVPDLHLDLQGRSGPIMVMIDYMIAEKDIPEFLTVMAERRRIRRRDGARQWVLLRDLEHPDQWSESYHVATWDEYQRHNMRRTKADADVMTELYRMHRSPDRPRVHRMIERQSVYSHKDFPLKETL